MFTPREIAFIDALFTRGESWLNATGAARAAGYAWPGKQAWQVHSRPRVNAEVERRFQALREQARGHLGRP